ncbi:hypothetical protein GCM10010345_93170 [Streptomyces canarius]|uniref:Uncharacterized protein n=1 Tax=Streptomyces canarius TaxID=285453 RepID=A0ABQ3DCK6_9ACTN|nr:hypothetical protein GCM10010345_93170 [Streptomyces canarius]
MFGSISVVIKGVGDLTGGQEGTAVQTGHGPGGLPKWPFAPRAPQTRIFRAREARCGAGR